MKATMEVKVFSENVVQPEGRQMKVYRHYTRPRTEKGRLALKRIDMYLATVEKGQWFTVSDLVMWLEAHGYPNDRNSIMSSLQMNRTLDKDAAPYRYTWRFRKR